MRQGDRGLGTADEQVVWESGVEIVLGAVAN
jgi:hypothetical protein